MYRAPLLSLVAVAIVSPGVFLNTTTTEAHSNGVSSRRLGDHNIEASINHNISGKYNDRQKRRELIELNFIQQLWNLILQFLGIEPPTVTIPQPTTIPTVPPTLEPTKTPTSAPTLSTSIPTLPPTTLEPTLLPTIEPTSSPTPAPNQGDASSLYCFPPDDERVRYDLWGYQVEVKEDTENLCGPGDNKFSTNTVSVQNDNEITLQFKQVDGEWHASEIRLFQTDGGIFDYGTYEFSVKSVSVKKPDGTIVSDSLPPSLVLGLFTWDIIDDFSENENWSHEVDIEISRWNDPLNNHDAQFLVQPPGSPQQYRFSTGVEVGTRNQSGHRWQFTWNPGEIIWSTDAGGGQSHVYSTEIAFNAGEPDLVQCLPANVEVRMNLWNILGVNNPTGMELDDIVEVVIDDFVYTASNNDFIAAGSRCSKDCQCEIGCSDDGFCSAPDIPNLQPTSSPTPMPNVFQPEPKCTCNSCTSEVLNSDAFGFTCGERIQFLQTDNFESTLYPTEVDACARVAGVEYPSVCGACDPSSCDGRTPPPPERTSFCGCEDTCTLDVWNSIAVDNLSCAAHITYIQTHDPALSNEAAACLSFAEQFPDSPCGQLCNPATCNGNAAPPLDRVCGCRDCTNEILERDAAGFTCGDRIAFVQTPRGGGLSETDACTLVSGTEFRDICGPQCDPSRCDGKDGAENPDTNSLGPNVILFDASMTTAEIQSTFDSIFFQQVNNEMGAERYSLYFKPGTYGSADEPLQLNIGYYTEVAGLGSLPDDVVINGKIEVYNRCFEEDPYNAGKFIPTSAENGLCFALNNFWRSLSNLSINVIHSADTDQCRQTDMFWAISQASSMRRVKINGDLSLMDYCSEPGFASGGFIADTKVENGRVINGSQQQFIARNMIITEWDSSVWNNVFLGVVGAPDDSNYPDPPYTTIPTNPLNREKPYLFIEEGKYFVQVPSFKTASLGTSWEDGLTDGVAFPLSSFRVVTTNDSVEEINASVSEGKNLLFAPGVYEISEPITISRTDAIVLGIGHATLKATAGNTVIKIDDYEGIIVSGITIDAGAIESAVLMQVGNPGSTETGNSENPITLHDIYFRVGGPYIGKAKTCLEVNSDHVLIDHTWIWRADHGIEGFSETAGFDGDNERWTENIGVNGMVVNGDFVTCTGLFVEHFQQYNLIWNGEFGRVFFFQNELPYDPPSQSDWIANDGTLGWAGYKVADSVTDHELWGGGVYCYNRNDPTIVTENGFEVPVGQDGILMERIFTRNLSGPGTIQFVINGVGEQVDSVDKGPKYVTSYV